jgi:hypothetical protein
MFIISFCNIVDCIKDFLKLSLFFRADGFVKRSFLDILQTSFKPNKLDEKDWSHFLLCNYSLFNLNKLYKHNKNNIFPSILLL